MAKGKRHHRKSGQQSRSGVPGDAGMTLAELMVSMAVMSVVTALATTGIVQMYRDSTRTEALSSEMTQLQVAFQQLDRSVRYATGISEPNVTATPGGDWYVEWSTMAGGETSCTQLRLHGSTGLLQRRSATTAHVTGWATVASFVVGSRPFVMLPASTSGFPHQQLTVDLTVQPPEGSPQPARRSTFSFTALNTSLATQSSSVCAEMGRP